MTLQRHLQLLRNSKPYADYEAAKAGVLSAVVNQDGVPVLARYYYGEAKNGQARPVRTLLGLVYRKDGTNQVTILDAENNIDENTVDSLIEQYVNDNLNADDTPVAGQFVTAVSMESGGTRVERAAVSADQVSFSGSGYTAATVGAAIRELQGKARDGLDELASATTVQIETLDADSVVTIDNPSNLRYVIYQGDPADPANKIGEINIPKDTVVSEGEIITADGTELNGTSTAATSANLDAGEKYVKLTLANADETRNLVYIAVTDLVDVYTGSSGGVVNISVNGYTISASVNDGSITGGKIARNTISGSNIADGAVGTAQIADGVIPDVSGLATKTEVSTGLAGKVDKVNGYGLSEADYTAAEKTKLAGIAEGAEVNVQSDWNASGGGAAILNKPTIPTKTSDLEKDDTYTKNQADVAIAQAMLGGVTGITTPFTLVKVGDTWMLADNSPRITLSDASLTMRGETKVATFRVSGVNLQSDISVSVENSAADWSVSPATIQAVNGIVNETVVTVTYSGADSASANILVSTTGSSGRVSVNYVAAPVLALSSNAISLNSESGVVATATVQLTGANLEASSIAIAINGSGFSVSPNAVTPSSGAVNETLTITRAADASASSATLTITDATDEITINASVEWVETERDNVGDVVTRIHGYASADDATPTIGVNYLIEKKVGVNGATTNEVNLVNKHGNLSYNEGDNYTNVHHYIVPLVININGTDYKVTKLRGCSLSNISTLKSIGFELDQNGKTNLREIPVDGNMGVWERSGNFKGSDGEGTLVWADGITTFGDRWGLYCEKIIVPNSVTSLGIPHNAASANYSIKYIDYGTGVSSLHHMNNLKSLKTIILRRDGVVTPNTTTAFWSQFIDNKLQVYVPDNRVSAYQSSAWGTTLANYVDIHSINDLPNS